MLHDHFHRHHHVHCKHYCWQCGVTYCCDCGEEWGSFSRSWGPWNYRFKDPDYQICAHSHS